MPERVTRRELLHTVGVLHTRGYDIAIHWAYGQPRCTTEDQSKDLSPRLSMHEMQQWLDGFEKGAEAADRRITETDRALALLIRNVSRISGNPYGNDDVKRALLALAEKMGLRLANYLDAADHLIKREGMQALIKE